MPEILGFFPDVLTIVLGVLFFGLLFLRRFFGAFLVPFAVIYLCSLIEELIQTISIGKIALIIIITSIVLLVARHLYKN